MEKYLEYIKNYKNFNKTIIYDFRITLGGIGDYLKLYMCCLTYCMANNIKLYQKINNIPLEKYIKLKHDFLYITQKQISKLTNVTIKTPCDYYRFYRKNKYISNIPLNEIFYFDDIVKLNVKNILPLIPTNYISMHLRLGDKFLETDKKFVRCTGDTRNFSEEKIDKFIEEHIDDNILFFCDNNTYKLKVKDKYKNIIITSADIGHSSFINTTDKQVLDTVTEFYILSNSELIYAASNSGFSLTASQFNNIKYLTQN